MLKFSFIFIFSILLVLLNTISAVPKFKKEPRKAQQSDKMPVTQQYLERTLVVDEPVYLFRNKRSCIRRGGNCDHRPNDCCYHGSCRCTMWGSNCQCQHMGVLQK